MFEKIFREVTGTISAQASLVDELWTEIKTAYTQPSRHYHNLHHLVSLITELTTIKGELSDWRTIVLSVAYHDVVYKVAKTNNEEKSAHFAYERLTRLGWPATEKEKCRKQILATRGHHASNDTDTNYFTDADLSILGHDNHSYLEYAQQIREEYKVYPDLLYKPGRKKVLTAFLNRDTIFQTDYFRGKYEKQARANIAMELKLL